MNYNIHPLLVHFPIAFLVIYSVIKILPLKKWFPSVSWNHIERVLLVVGVCGAMAASSTGEVAEHLVRPNRQLVEMHSTFAALSTWMYGILLAGEALLVLNAGILQKLSSPVVMKVSLWLQSVICSRVVGITLALVGLVAISVTGLLGGVMVYGTTADPVAGWVVQLLGISL